MANEIISPLYPLLQSGVYLITCINNKRSYCGSSFHMEKRRKSHIWYLINNLHPNIRLQKDFNKYGIKSFIFEIIHISEEKINRIEKEKEKIIELQAANNAYNISIPSIPCIKKSNKVLKKQCDDNKKIKLQYYHLDNWDIGRNSQKYTHK